MTKQHRHKKICCTLLGSSYVKYDKGGGVYSRNVGRALCVLHQLKIIIVQEMEFGIICSHEKPEKLLNTLPRLGVIRS